MVNTVAAPADPARVEGPLAQAVRRTGLADSAGGMAALCERRELIVTPRVHGRARVDLRLFGNGAAP
jgi:hypothetical protein